MSKISLQFHATVDELFEYIRDNFIENDLFLVSFQLFPEFTYELINKFDIDNKKDSIIKSRMIYLYIYKPDITINNYMKFLEVNKDFLLIQFGKQEKTRLSESSMSTICNNSDSLIVWKRIINKFKRSLLKGAWVYAPNTGTRRYYKDLKYTKSAQQLFNDGVKILPYYDAITNYEYLLTDKFIYKDFVYIKFNKIHNNDNNLEIIYSELDKDRFEVRKVEVYKDGRHRYASNDYSSKDIFLSKTPIPIINEFALDNQPTVITKDEFYKVWEFAINNFYEG